MSEPADTPLPKDDAAAAPAATGAVLVPDAPPPARAAATVEAAPPASAASETTSEDEEADEAEFSPAAPAASDDDEDGDDEVLSREVPRHFTAPAMIALDRVDDDDTFRVRTEEELEDVSRLATDIARLGQLFPIDVRLKPPDRFQIISGFRRVAALRFLKREKVLARLHTDLSDADAMLLALASAIHVRSVSREALEAARERLLQAGRLTPAGRDMLDKALAADDELAPEEVEEEVDADELAADASLRLGQINQDLALLADVFADLEPARREELLKQLRYSSDLVAWLESKA